MMPLLRLLLYRLTLAVLRCVPQGRGRRCRLVILKLDRLGDAVLSLGAVRLLLAEFGAADSLLIVSTVAEPLFRREFPAVELLVMPPFSERFWPDFVHIMARHAAQLRAIQADHLVILRHQASDYLHAIAALVHARHLHASECLHPLERVCLSYPRCHHVPYPTQSEAGCLELEAHRRVVQSAVNHPVVFHDIIPVIAPAASAPAAHAGTLLVCPLTGSAIRQYPPAQLARAVALFLQSTPGLRVTFCLPPEAGRTPWEQAVVEAGLPTVEWLHPENLPALLQAISAARLVLAPESAPAHLTTAMNQPGVFLLGGGHYGMLAPWRRSPRQVWLSHPTDCYHCQWRCIHPEPLCLTHIPPSAIAAALQEVHGASSGIG